MNNKQILDADRQHIWHPCAQMKDYESWPPLIIKRAFGSYLELTNGQLIIDAISSWWCKSLGHNLREIKIAVQKQLMQFEHVMFANITYEVIAELSQRLAQLIPGLSKSFYASDGSTAIEIALKMSLHSRVIQGETKRTKFLALANGYHGETIGALSVSDSRMYREPYAALTFDTHFIPVPYVSGATDPLWHNAEQAWQVVEKSLELFAETTTAIVFEPIVQGAADMQIYSQDFLQRLANWAKAHDIHLIADEIMTGIGRTGKMLACEHANIQPDFICLSKGLTSGWLPLSVVLTTDSIYEIFYDDDPRKAFLHSNTYAGNALAASAAVATLDYIATHNICAQTEKLQTTMMSHFKTIAEQTGMLTNLRGIGGIVAADLITNDPQLGKKIFHAAVKSGALLRPLGNTLYWLPPLNIEETTLEELKNITLNAIEKVGVTQQAYC